MKHEVKEMTSEYKAFVSQLNDKELLSLAYDHEIRMEGDFGEISFYTESIFTLESRPNSTSVDTMVDIVLSKNNLLKEAWLETKARGIISVLNQYIIVNCVRQMLIDRTNQSVEEALQPI